MPGLKSRLVESSSLSFPRSGFLGSGSRAGRLVAGATFGALALAMVACSPFGGSSTNGSLVLKHQAQTSSATGNYLAGRHAQSARDMAAAADYMTLALEEEPDNTDILRRAYILMTIDGRMSEASGIAQRLITFSPNEPVANITLALEAAKKGRWKEAQKYIQAAPRTGINGLVAPLLEAWFLAGDGKTDAALTTLDTNKSASVGALFTLHAGLIDDLADRKADAAKRYEEAVQDTGGGSFRVLTVLGNFYERQGRNAEAAKLYAGYAEQSPETAVTEAALARTKAGGKPKALVTDARTGLAEALFGMASTLRSQNAGEVALIFGRMAQDMAPTLDINLMLVGDVLETQGRSEAAINAYKAIPIDSPFNWPARMRMANLLGEMGKTDLAVAQLQSMIRERPDRSDALVALGDLQRSQQNFGPAVEAYDQALERVGKLDKRHWSILYSRGIALERSKKWVKAEADFLRALELEPDQPFVLNYLGYSWVEQGMNLDKAKGMIQRAVDLRPADGYIVDSLGWAMFRTGKYDVAVRDLERAVELRPQDPTINDHLGDAYWKVGRLNEARFQWRRAMTLKPEPQDLATIESKLQSGLEAAKKTAESR